MHNITGMNYKDTVTIPWDKPTDPWDKPTESLAFSAKNHNLESSVLDSH